MSCVGSVLSGASSTPLASSLRQKEENHISGDFPFVMSGTTNTGLVAKISNPIVRFPSNSITIDIFGNVFYRSYEFSASDDLGDYWSNEVISQEAMLFMVTVIAKRLDGQYSFGKKSRSSQSVDLSVSLPVSANGEPDYKCMTSFIRVQQKLSIQNSSGWSNKNE